MARRYTPDEVRSMVASAMHQLDRPDLLEDSALTVYFNLQGRGGYWPRGRALRELLLQAAARVSAELADIPGFAEKQSLLNDVVSGKPIASWAREHRRTREAVSRGMWKELCELVADEAARLALAAPTNVHG